MNLRVMENEIYRLGIMIFVESENKNEIILQLCIQFYSTHGKKVKLMLYF